MTAWVLFVLVITNSHPTVMHYELKDKDQCLNLKKNIDKHWEYTRSFCQEVKK